jgi:hypothetical protein
LNIPAEDGSWAFLASRLDAAKELAQMDELE